MTRKTNTRPPRIEQEILELADSLLKAHHSVETKLARLLAKLRILHEHDPDLALYTRDDLPF